MKLYIIKKGTECKLITQVPNGDIAISDWVTRKETTYNHPAFDAVGYHNMNPKPSENTVAVRLVKEGYSLFSESGSANDKYILAVKSTDVELLI